MGFQLCRKIIELSLQLKEFCVLVNLCVYELLVLFHEGDNVVCVCLYFFCEVGKQIHAQLVFERVHILAKSLERERDVHTISKLLFLWIRGLDAVMPGMFMIERRFPLCRIRATRTHLCCQICS